MGVSREFEIKYVIPDLAFGSDEIPELVLDLKSFIKELAGNNDYKNPEKKSEGDLLARYYFYYDTPDYNALQNNDTIRQIFGIGNSFINPWRVQYKSGDPMQRLESPALNLPARLDSEEIIPKIRQNCPELRLHEYDNIYETVRAHTVHLKWAFGEKLAGSYEGGKEVEIKLDRFFVDDSPFAFSELEFEIKLHDDVVMDQAGIDKAREFLIRLSGPFTDKYNLKPWSMQKYTHAAYLKDQEGMRDNIPENKLEVLVDLYR